MTVVASGQFGAAARDISVTIVNCSASGCLLLSSTPLTVGTTGSLRLVINGVEATDVVEVVRCHRVEGSSAYHVGARFLWTTPPRIDSIRHVLPRVAAAGPYVVNSGAPLRQ